MSASVGDENENGKGENDIDAACNNVDLKKCERIKSQWFIVQRYMKPSQPNTEVGG